MYLHYTLGYYQNVDRYIAVSKFYKQKMLDNGFSEEQVVYLPNFIDVNQYPLSQEDDGYVLYFGRLSEEKGVDTLLSAAKQSPDINFIIVGTGPIEAELRAIAKDMKNVSFVGFKSGNELSELIAKAAFTVIPSKWYENCPMSVLESFAFGKPVIGARIGGIPELIDEGKDGLCLESSNSHDLSSKIKYLQNIGKKARLNLGKNGHTKIKEHFSPENHYEQLVKLYKAVI
jgi:glycosyltransferase involved in cell wall biosynthesis